MDAAGRDLRTLFGVGVTGPPSEGQLLERFIARREGAVFEAVVRRHGPMVWGVCRRILRDHHDAEDAFQATFLVLARRAASVVPREGLANWLYGVAYKTSLKAKAVRAKRRGREVQAVAVPEPEAGRTEERDELRDVLDLELSRLPDKYRTPVLLCDLEEKTHQEAADQLGWPVGTVSGRLSRGRAMLAKRLARRGVSASVGGLAVAVARSAGAGVPPSLAAATADAAAAFAAGGSAAGLVSGGAAALTEGVLKAMLLSKVKTIAAVAIGVGLLLAGVGGAVALARAAAAPATADGKGGDLPPGFDPVFVARAPDGSRTAVIGGWNPESGPQRYGLFFVEKGGRVRQLVEQALKMPGAWSPDARTFAFSNGPSYWYDNPLVLVDAETGALTETGVQGLWPAWSPDGRVVAVGTEFDGSRGGWFGGPAGGRIALWDVAAKTLTPVTPPGYLLDDRKSGAFVTGGTRFPAWSPDGRRLAFQRWEYGPEKVGEVWVVDRDGTGLRKALGAAKYAEAAWSPDGRFVGVKGEDGGIKDKVEVDRLPVVAAADWPGPPKDLAAAVAAADKARKAAEAVDLGPVFRRNRAWWNPTLDHLRGVRFVHQMEPNRLDERFVWRADGATLFEVVRRDDARAAEEVGRLRVTAPDGVRYDLAPKGRYPRVTPQSAAVRAEEVFNHLMGTRLLITAIQWGRAPEDFERLSLAPGPDPGTTVLDLAPSLSALRRRDDRPSLNAGAMFETTSWAYVHGLRAARSALTFDANDHRLVREVDYDAKGDVICDARFEDWLDVGDGRSVPRRVRVDFPGQKFHVDDRFQWRPEGLWVLERGESRFDGHGPEREAVVDLAVNAPTPELDRALERALEAQKRLDAPPDPGVEKRPLRLLPFAFSPAEHATPSGATVRFTLAVGDSLRRIGGRPQRRRPQLIAQVSPADRDRTLILADEQGLPIKAVRVPPSKQGPTRVELGEGVELALTRYWTLADPGGSPGKPADDSKAVDVPTFPYRENADLIAQTPALPTLAGWDRDKDATAVRSVRLGADDRGGATARVELVSRSTMRIYWATVTALLLDADDLPIAAATLNHEFRVEHAIYDAPDLPLTFGPLHGRTPKRLVLGLRTVVTGGPVGSMWGHYAIGYRTPLFPADRLLVSDDPAVWGYGVAVVDDEAHQGIHTSRFSRPEDPPRLDSASRGGLRRAIGPHADRLLALASKPAASPDVTAALCVLLGYSGRPDAAPILRALLDHSDPSVRDHALIGLGLLGAPDVRDRLLALRDRVGTLKADDIRTSRLRVDLARAVSETDAPAAPKSK